MPSKQPRQDLKRDIREALEAYLPAGERAAASYVVLAAVLPHFEAAYKRGEIAAKLRQGSRLVVKNEELRRDLRRLKEEQ